jgi:lipopolysaccharide transport system permease protein
VFWQLFIESAQTPLRVFSEARLMLAKLNFPREALFEAALLEVSLQFLLRTPLLAAAWWLSPFSSAEHWLLLPVAIAGVMAAGALVGLVLLPFSLLYEDVAPGFALASGFWLLITPVAYSVPRTGAAAILARWNPAATLINVPRSLFLGESGAALGPFFVLVAGATLALLLVWLAARVAFPHMIARFGS